MLPGVVIDSISVANHCGAFQSANTEEKIFSFLRSNAGGRRCMWSAVDANTQTAGPNERDGAARAHSRSRQVEKQKTMAQLQDTAGNVVNQGVGVANELRCKGDVDGRVHGLVFVSHSSYIVLPSVVSVVLGWRCFFLF